MGRHAHRARDAARPRIGARPEAQEGLGGEGIYETSRVAAHGRDDLDFALNAFAEVKDL